MFIDSHCHLNFACFDIQREMLLKALEQIEINEKKTRNGNGNNR